MTDPESRQPGPRIAVFAVALPLGVAIALTGIIYPDFLARLAGGVTHLFFRSVDWFFVTLVTGLLVTSIWLALSRFGDIRLGHPEDRPEFSRTSWLAMLFAAGMGTGLLFWGVAEPVTHFDEYPGVPRGTPEAARQAMLMTNLHWGLHIWSVYAITALVLAYFGFRRGGVYLPGTPIRDGLTGRWVPAVAWLADLVAILAVALGVAGSLGMGVFQLQSGLSVLAGTDPHGLTTGVIILAVLGICYMASAATRLGQGIKWLSNLNMALAVLVLGAVLFAGPTGVLMADFINSVGDYVAALPRLSLQLYAYEPDTAWFHTWTLTWFIWTISWAPFVGIFIARISRGRTIREFVFGVLLAPAGFSILWFSVFGGTALHEELQGAGGMVALVRDDPSVALFSLFDRLPLSELLSAAALLLVFIFLVTSADSATFVLGMFTSGGSLEPPVLRKLAWGVTLAALTAALLVSGNVGAIRAVIVFGAIPFTAVIVIQLVAFLRALRLEPRY